MRSGAAPPLTWVLTWALLAYGCESRPEQTSAPLDQRGWTPIADVESEGGDVRVVVHTDAAPVPVNALHQWKIQVLRGGDGGKAFMPEALVVNGGMPSHGHGLPTQPTVSQYLGDGTFVVDGMRFNMGGPWEMVVRVLDGNRWHRLAFPLTLGHQPDDAHAHHGTGWTPAERALLDTLSWSAAGKRPRDRTNRFENDARAVDLGQTLFFDERLSGNGKVSCASCHQPSRSFADGRKTGKGITALDRNTPTVIGSARQRWQYWDGRRDSLWAQALVPIEAAAEMGSSRLAVLRTIADDARYKAQYEALFGPLPSLEGLSEPHAAPIGPVPHQEAWKRIPVRTRRSINEAYANVGKAIAAYESTLDFTPSRFDHAVAGSTEEPLTVSEIAGIRLFLDPKNQCLKCHNGPTFSNGGFHNIGTGSSDPDDPDVGRIAGLQAVLLDEFNCLGRHSDDRSRCDELDHLAPEAHLAGAFKVPSLRGVANTAPYMHDGRFDTLREVLEFYRAPGAPNPSMPHELIPLPHLTDQDLENLEAFLKTL